MHIPASAAFGGFGQHGWLHWSHEQQWGVLYAQNFMLICFVWCLAWMSPSFLHRTFSIIHSIPFKNKVWMGAFVLSIVLQFCFCAVSLAHGPFRLDSIPWYVYFLGFIWPLVLLPIQEVVKMHDNKEFTRFQKRSKLEFSTKVRARNQSKIPLLILYFSIAWNAFTLVELFLVTYTTTCVIFIQLNIQFHAHNPNHGYHTRGE